MVSERDTVFSPISPQEALHHTPSAREKEVTGATPTSPSQQETVLFSPVSPLAVRSSPITNYNERPQEAPQALTTETYPDLDAKDNAVNAPEVLKVDRSPPFIVEDQHIGTSPTTTAVPSEHVTSPGADARDAPSANSLRSLSAIESGDTGPAKEGAPPPKEPRILGLKKRTFWIVLAVLLAVITAAAIGGGVGGSRANKNSSSNNNNNSDSENSIIPTEPPIIKGWNLTIYAERNFTGETLLLDTIGLYPLSFPAPENAPSPILPDPSGNGTYNATVGNSYRWRSGESGCCVKFCANGTDIGYRCRSESENPGIAFDRVALACGGEPKASVCTEEVG